MTRRGRTCGRAAAALLALALGACAGIYQGSRTSGTAAFDDTWPEAIAPYPEVYDDWTRRGRLVRDFDRVIDITATYKSPEWRAAYVEKRARYERLPKPEADDLARRELEDSRAFHEVELLVITYHRDDNDLQKNERSRWRVVLVDEQGQQIPATEIRRDIRSRQTLRELFLDLDPMHQVYIARFPRTSSLLSQSRFSLLVASLDGDVELTWKNR